MITFCLLRSQKVTVEGRVQLPVGRERKRRNGGRKYTREIKVKDMKINGIWRSDD